MLDVPGMAERTILLDGWSKTWAMTGWRLGYGVYPTELVEPIRSLAERPEPLSRRPAAALRR